MLRLKNITVSLGDSLLCKNQKIEISEGVCIIVGENDSLKNALAHIFTGSPLYDTVELVWDVQFEVDDEEMDYTKFRKYLNPFIHFDQKDTVKSTIMFANHILYEKIITDFKLEEVEDKRVIDLNVSAFRVWEMAMAAASQSKIVYVSQTFTSRKKFKYLLKKMKEYLKDIGAYIFVEVYDFIECKAENVLEISGSKISSKCLLKKNKHKNVNNYLFNTKIDESLLFKKKKTIAKSNAFIKAYITGDETSSSVYSSAEHPNEYVFNPPKQNRFLITSLSTEILASFSRIFWWFWLFLCLILKGHWRALNISLGDSGFSVLLYRCQIFFNRKFKKIDKLMNFYVSIGILSYSYFLIRYFKPLLMGFILLFAFLVDMLWIFLCIMLFYRISKFLICYFRMFRLNNPFTKKHDCLDCDDTKLFHTPLSSGKCFLTRTLLKMTREQGECFFITNFNEIRADFWIRFYFSLCFQCTMSFYNSIGFSANLSLKRVLLCFYETWCRSLSNFESNSISLIMIFSVLSFNYNLIAEDLDFLRENLYITIHPFTYYVYILTHTFVSTLPIFIFSLFTSFSFLLIYYNLLLISSILNSFNNMSFKVIIISILMILQFLFPHGFGLNILYSQLITNIICGIIKLVVSYSTFCVFISVYRKV